MSPKTTLSNRYPWTIEPLIANGPMGGFATAALASAVTISGGLGFLAGGYNVSALSQELRTVSAQLSESRFDHKSQYLPIGIGFLCFLGKQEEIVNLVKEHRPVAVWLFAAEKVDEYAEWADTIRKGASSDEYTPHIWIQTGSVADAVKITKIARPEVLVLQGADAGGHGLEKGAGVVSLVPETVDALRAAGLHKDISIIAAGGIVDGRGLAAALALGAEGVVMGTRFLASSEAGGHKGYKAAILAAEDGGQSTGRSKIFDEAKPDGNTWPYEYDGRGLRNLTMKDNLDGRAIEEIRNDLSEAGKKEGGGFDGGADVRRSTVWAGTGVGLVKEMKGADEIVKEVRNSAKEIVSDVWFRKW